MTNVAIQPTLVGSNYSLGANAYVVKPLNFSAFAKAVGSLGVFWTMTNESPPAAVSASVS